MLPISSVIVNFNMIAKGEPFVMSVSVLLGAM